jgi:hypothetical protein
MSPIFDQEPELDEAVVARGLVQPERLRASLVAHLAQFHAA